MKEDNPQLISYHCIIHQLVLCSTLSDKYAEVMNIMIRILNFLRASSSHQHRMLREFLREGKIAPLLAQLNSQKATTFSLFLENDKKMDIVAFLVDIPSHLNELNLKLQGKDNSVCDLMTAVCSFQMKLALFREDLQGDCAHFPTVKKQPIVNFSNFDSFSLGQKLIQNPFVITDVRGFSKEVPQLF
ncbi:hypothetical protein FQN60_012917, partial [Etheostoma spectabile]